ncbi:hypothetical protein Chor_009990 [Crotalus horridus]
MPGIVCTNLSIAPGQKVSVKGDVLSGAKSLRILFTHDKKEVTITLSDNHQIKFPNDSGLETIDFICTEGDLCFKILSLV